MSILNRLKKYAGLNKDKDRCPSNPCVTVREAIEVADHIELLTKQRDVLLRDNSRLMAAIEKIAHGNKEEFYESFDVVAEFAYKALQDIQK